MLFFKLSKFSAYNWGFLYDVGDLYAHIAGA